MTTILATPLALDMFTARAPDELVDSAIIATGHVSSSLAAALQGGGLNFFMMLVQTIAALLLVCGLAYALFRWVLPRLQITGAANRMVRVIDVVPLGPRRSLHVIEVAGRWLLIASSEAGVQLISELDAESAAQAAASLQQQRAARSGFGTVVTTGGGFADQLARIMSRRK